MKYFLKLATVAVVGMAMFLSWSYCALIALFDLGPTDESRFGATAGIATVLTVIWFAWVKTWGEEREVGKW